MRALTELVAEELRLTDDESDRLQWAALLHDIGKLSVPAEILNKPGKPDDAERAVLRRHPVEGARLAAAVQPWLGEWADAIAQHHECFDGTGYPEGLAGEHISLAGRIVSVTDAYETMTAVRSYKRPMSAAAARTELARCAGTHFDPRVVRAFLALSLGRLHWPAGGALAGLVALRPVGALARLGARASASAARPATATKATAAIGVLVLGGLLAAGSGVTSGTDRPFAAGNDSDAGERASSTGSDEPEAVRSVRPADPPASAPLAPTPPASTPPASTPPDGATAAAVTAAPTPGPGPGSGPAPAPPAAAPAPPLPGGAPSAGSPPPLPPAAPSPTPTSPPASDSGGGSPGVGVQIGPIGLTLLPQPSVQVGDLTLPLLP